MHLAKLKRFLIKLGFALITLALIILVTFLLLKLMPGNVVNDYALKLQAERNITYEAAYKLAVQMLNYDPAESIFMQFWRYFTGLLGGNLGQSIYRNDLSANTIIAQALPWTLLVSSVSLVLSFVIGTRIGSHMAWKRKSKSDLVLTSYVVVTNSIPDYLLGLVFIVLFGFGLKWFPTYGAYSASTKVGFNFEFIGDVLWHAALPMITYTITQIGGWALSAKGAALSVMGDDYINAAIARGIPERVIVKRYLKKNTLLPLVTSLVVSFAYIFGGSTVMESMFNYPGIGFAFGTYIGQRDYFVVQGLFFFMGTMVVLANLISDSIYSLLDPRVRSV